MFETPSLLRVLAPHGVFGLYFARRIFPQWFPAWRRSSISRCTIESAKLHAQTESRTRSDSGPNRAVIARMEVSFTSLFPGDNISRSSTIRPPLETSPPTVKHRPPVLFIRILALDFLHSLYGRLTLHFRQVLRGVHFVFPHPGRRLFNVCPDNSIGVPVLGNIYCSRITWA